MLLCTGKRECTDFKDERGRETDTDTDTKFRSFLDAWNDHRIPRSWCKRIRLLGQKKNWSQFKLNFSLCAAGCHASLFSISFSSISCYHCKTHWGICKRPLLFTTIRVHALYTPRKSKSKLMCALLILSTLSLSLALSSFCNILSRILR